MKKGIIVASFGTSFHDVLRNNIESVEDLTRKAFTDYEVRRAFTSNMIMKKLLTRDNVKIDTVYEALEKMASEGFEEVIVQPTHIMFGDEYDKVANAVEEFWAKDVFKKLELGRPLLYNNEDYITASKALTTQIPSLGEEHAVVLMAHGTTHPANASYFQFEYVAKNTISENIYLATVEGYPLIEDIIPKLKEKNIKEVTLMPFMLVAGDHANNDMAGEEEDSWKNILTKEGFKVNIVLKGLGENRAFQNIYIEHIKDCIKDVVYNFRVDIY